MAEFNGINGDWEEIKKSLSDNIDFERSDKYPNSDMTGSDIPMALMGALGMPSAARAGEASIPEGMGMLKGLGEAGEITIGKAAPQFEGKFPDVVRYLKGVMGKGTPNEARIWGVKGPAEQIEGIGYGADPGSVPEHILDKLGIPEEAPPMNMGAESSPTGYASGGEVMRHYDNGGDVTDPNDEAAQLLSGQGNGMSFLQGTPQMAAQPANMQNAALAGIAGAFTPQDPPIPPMSEAPNAGPVGPGPQYADMPPTPQQPHLAQAAQNAQNMPPTDYSLFKGISADDRANLYKQLLAQKASPGNMIASGVAGLGDAVSNAFGKGGQHAQQDVREAQAKNVENVIGGVDTQRKQKLEDISANQEAALADPMSPLSQSLRKTLKAAGVNAPSNMPGSMLLKITGPLGELAMKQATLEENKRYHTGELGQQAAALRSKEDIYKSEHPILNMLNPVGNEHPTSPVSNTNLQGMPSSPLSFPDQNKEAKYQAWKASQGR